MQLTKAINRFLDGYFSTCQRSEKTIRAYSIDLRQFREYVGGRKTLAKIGPEELEGWAAELRGAGYASSSIRRKFAALKVFFGYWVRRGELEQSPTWRIRLDLAPEEWVLVKVLTVDEVRRILRQAKRELGRYPRKLIRGNVWHCRLTASHIVRPPPMSTIVEISPSTIPAFSLIRSGELIWTGHMANFDRIDRYPIIRRAGGGGFSDVYEAWDYGTERSVAIKILKKTDPEHLERFQREASNYSRSQQDDCRGTSDLRPRLRQTS